MVLFDEGKTEVNMKLVSLILLCLIISCTKSEIPDRNTLNVALSSPPSTLDPRRTTDATGQRIVALLFNSLVRTGPDLRVMGDASESWTYKDLVYTFKLKKGLKFSNGRALAASDIDFTFKEYKKNGSPFQSTLSPVTSVKVDTKGDDTYVRLQLSKFHAPLLDDLSSIKLLPQAEVEKAGDDFGRNPIGTGSYVFKSQDSQQIVIEARTEHPVVVPKTAKVVFKIIQDDSTRNLKMKKGAIDIAQQELPQNKINEYENHADFRVVKFPGLSMNYLLLNLRNEKLQNLKLRKAMSLSINRDEIIKFKLSGLGTPASTIITPIHPMFVKELRAPVFDLAAAKQLAKDLIQGTEFTLKTSNIPSAVENGKVVAHQLEQTGLKVKLQSYEWATFYGDVKTGNFELALMRWVGTTDPDIYRLAFHSSELPPGRNRGAYINKTLDKLLEAGPTIVDSVKRYEHYKKIQTIVLEELPIIPLWYDTQVAVIHSRVNDYDPPINGDYTGLFKAWKN
jgi:peptide/nickel transport system substrate-binding protein